MLSQIKNSKTVKINFIFSFSALIFPVEVEGFFDLFFRGSLVDTYVADVAEKSEVDNSVHVFLVMLHECDELLVVITCDVHASVVVADEGNGLPHLVCREAGEHAAEV